MDTNWDFLKNDWVLPSELEYEKKTVTLRSHVDLTEDKQKTSSFTNGQYGTNIGLSSSSDFHVMKPEWMTQKYDDIKEKDKTSVPHKGLSNILTRTRSSRESERKAHQRMGYAFMMENDNKYPNGRSLPDETMKEDNKREEEDIEQRDIENAITEQKNRGKENSHPQEIRNEVKEEEEEKGETEEKFLNQKNKKIKTKREGNQNSEDLEENERSDICGPLSEILGLDKEYYLKSWIDFHLNPFLREPDWKFPEGFREQNDPYTSFTIPQESLFSYFSSSSSRQMSDHLTTRTQSTAQTYQMNPFSEIQLDGTQY